MFTERHPHEIIALSLTKNFIKTPFRFARLIAKNVISFSTVGNLKIILIIKIFTIVTIALCEHLFATPSSRLYFCKSTVHEVYSKNISKMLQLDICFSIESEHN